MSLEGAHLSLFKSVSILLVPLLDSVATISFSSIVPWWFFLFQVFTMIPQAVVFTKAGVHFSSEQNFNQVLFFLFFPSKSNWAINSIKMPWTKPALLLENLFVSLISDCQAKRTSSPFLSDSLYSFTKDKALISYNKRAIKTSSCVTGSSVKLFFFVFQNKKCYHGYRINISPDTILSIRSFP